MNLVTLTLLGSLSLLQHEGHGGHTMQPAGADSAPRAAAVAHGGEGTPPEVVLSQEDITAVGLRTELPRQADFARTIRAPAVVSVDERRVAHIHTRFSGYIEKLHANFIGQAVKKGQPLVEMFSPDVLAAQGEWVTALNQRDEAKKRGASEAEAKSRAALAAAARQRLTLWDLSPAFLDRVEKSRKPERTVTLYSPLQGTITVKQAVQGLFVGPDVHLFEVADLNRVWVVADVYPHELADIHVGSSAVFTMDNSTLTTTGQVEFIAPTVNAATRTVSIRVTFDNSSDQLKPGTYGALSVEAPARPGLAIPDQAVLLTGQRSVVFVQVAPGRFSAREVTLGRRVPGLVEVTANLKEGEPVVVSAQFVLDAESQLKSTAGHGAHGGH